MENHHVLKEKQPYMTIFNSYVSLPEGKHHKFPQQTDRQWVGNFSKFQVTITVWEVDSTNRKD